MQPSLIHVPSHREVDDVLRCMHLGIGLSLDVPPTLPTPRSILGSGVLSTWMREDLGVTLGGTPRASGTIPPAVTLTGTLTGVPDLYLKIDGAGARGTATFRWSLDDGATFVATSVLTAATVTLSGAASAVIVNFPVGAYLTDNIYNGAIATWSDQLSGNTISFVQGNVAKQPLHTYQGGPNSHGCIHFGPTDTWLQTAHDFSALTAGECFIVFRDTNEVAVNGNNCLWDFGSSGSASVIPFSDGNIYDDWGTDTRKSTGNPTPSIASYVAYNVISTSSEWTSLIDGTQHFTTATNTPGFLAGCIIGGDGGGVSFIEGDVVDFFMANRKMATAERNGCKQYLRGRYPAITIA